MNMIRNFWKDEDGIGVVEIVLILVILVALIVIFKDKITSIISSAFSHRSFLFIIRRWQAGIKRKLGRFKEEVRLRGQEEVPAASR